MCPKLSIVNVINTLCTCSCVLVQNQWSWLNSHADERARQIDNLIDKISEFDGQYIALRQFVDEGTQLCATEKPVGETASRVEEQMETCQVCVHVVYGVVY